MVKVLKSLLPVIIVTTALVIYLLRQFSTNLLHGIDGPYYLIQVRYLLHNLELKYPDPPLTFYMLSFFALIFNDIVFGIKVGAVVLTLISAIPLYFMIRELNGEVPAFISLTIYIFSPFIVRLMFDLVKNSVGLTFILLTLFFIIKTLKTHKPMYSILASLLISITSLTHILDFMFTVMFLLVMLLIYVILSLKSSNTGLAIKITKLMLPPLITSAVLILIGIALPYIFGGDMLKIESFIINLLTYLSAHVNEASIALLFKNNLYLFTIPIIIASLSVLLNLPKDVHAKVVTLTMITVLIILNIPLTPPEYLWRLNLMSLIPMSYILALIMNSIKSFRAVLPLHLVILGFIALFTINQLIVIKPSIPSEALNELNTIIRRFNTSNLYYVVPEVRLRYWVEVLTSNVVGNIEEIKSKEVSSIILILPRYLPHGHVPPHKPLPHPVPSRPLYLGKYFIAFRLG